LTILEIKLGHGEEDLQTGFKEELKLHMTGQLETKTHIRQLLLKEDM